jgi:hypothetical protein
MSIPSLLEHTLSFISAWKFFKWTWIKGYLFQIFWNNEQILLNKTSQNNILGWSLIIIHVLN